MLIMSSTLLLKRNFLHYSSTMIICFILARGVIDPSGTDGPKVNTVGEEGFIDPCSEEYDKHLERLSDGSIAGITPLGKYMHSTLQLYLKRHAIVHNVDKLNRKRKELEASIAVDKRSGKDCSKKEAALQLVKKDFFEYFDMWEKESKGPA